MGPRDPGELLVEEFQQAWAHYRHVESARSQYLGFMFTIVIGALGLAVPFSSKLDLSDGTMALLLDGFLAVLFVLSLFMCTSVMKFGMVLGHYDRVMAGVRQVYYEALPEDQVQRVLGFSVRNRDHPYLKSRFFRAQLTAEYILLGSAIGLCLAVIGVCIAHAAIAGPSPVLVVMGPIALGSGLLLATVLSVVRVARRTPPLTDVAQ